MLTVSYRIKLTFYWRDLCTHHLLSSLLPVHEALGDDPRGEDLVALTELLEEDAVGEAQTTDSDALQHSVAT